MLTRRDFIQTGTAAGVAALAAVPVQAGVAASAAPALPALAILDSVQDLRFAQSGAFAAALQGGQARQLSFTGDISPLWRSTLAADWRGGAQPIAGLTTHGPLFILERMAWGKDMRATFRGQHRVNAEGFLEHELQGPDSVIAALEESLPAAGLDFAPVLAQALAAHPLGAGLDRHVVLTTATPAALEEELYSYVLAPRCDCAGLAPYSHTHSA